MEYRGIEMVYWFEMGFKKVKNKQLKKHKETASFLLCMLLFTD